MNGISQDELNAFDAELRALAGRYQVLIMEDHDKHHYSRDGKPTVSFRKYELSAKFHQIEKISEDEKNLLE